METRGTDSFESISLFIFSGVFVFLLLFIVVLLFSVFIKRKKLKNKEEEDPVDFDDWK